MRVHFPERYEAHRARTVENLTFMAKQFGLSYEQFEASNWDHTGVKAMSEVEIDNGVPMPENTGWANVPENNGQPPAEAPAAPEAPKRRGRPPKAATGDPAQPAAPAKPKTTKAPSQAEQLEAALAFISPVEDDLQDFSLYVNLTNNAAVMYNGVTAAGHPIEESLRVAPHLSKLRAALKRSGKKLTLVETENFQLKIIGDKLQAIVPCMSVAELSQVMPDMPMLQGDFEVLKESFKICAALADENADRVVEASLLLEANTCTGTNGFTLIQHWHGIDSLPPKTTIPKLFADAVVKTPRKITGIGGTWDETLGKLSSLTIWFEGGCWLKTQCYNDNWPDLAHIIDIPSAPISVPAGFFEASEAVSDFLEDSSAVHFANGFASSHINSDEVGARYSLDLPEGLNKTFNSKLLKKIAPHVVSIDLTTYDEKAMFFGNSLRGAIMVMRN